MIQEEIWADILYGLYSSSCSYDQHHEKINSSQEAQSAWQLNIILKWHQTETTDTVHGDILGRFNGFNITAGHHAANTNRPTF